MLGTQDLLIILVIVLVLFGRKRLPDLIKAMREGIKNYKKGLSEPDEINVTPGKDKETASRRQVKKTGHSPPEKRG